MCHLFAHQDRIQATSYSQCSTPLFYTSFSIIQVEHERLVAAERILVVGGGIVGVELAGEIIVSFPQKQVTLVCSAGQLIPDKPPGIGLRALDFLEKRNVEVRDCKHYKAYKSISKFDR